MDELMEEENASSSEDSGISYAADSRWDELKEGETAMQFNDVFIKSGMTLGEAVETVNNSDTFLTWDSGSDYGMYDPDKEVQIETGSDSYSIPISVFTVDYNNNPIIRFYVPKELPGEEGDTYTMKDLPIILVGGHSYNSRYSNDVDEHPENTHTVMGTGADINALGKDGVENLKDTFFSGVDVKFDSSKSSGDGRNVVRYDYTVPHTFSWNGYSMEACYSWTRFDVDFDSDEMLGWDMWFMGDEVDEDSKWTRD